jgi:lipopolysaccharide export system permease protein
MSFALVALVSVLTGAFRRHGGLLRPAVAIVVVVGLLALGLALTNLAARNQLLIPLIYVQAMLPGVLCAIYLFASGAMPDALITRLLPRFLLVQD